jgi:chromosome segregation ATPase
MRCIGIGLVILLLSGFPLSSEVVLTDQEATELQSILDGLEIRLTEREKQLTTALENLQKAQTDLTESRLAFEKASEELTLTRILLDEALRSSEKLERERTALTVTLGSSWVVFVLYLIFQ